MDQHEFEEIPPPPVLLWFKIYAGLMAAMYLILCVVLVAAAVLDSNQKSEDVFVAVVVSIFCVPLGVAFLLPFFLGRQPWVWVYNLVLICLGLTSACCLVASVPLLIFWLKDDCKQYYGRT